MKTIRMESDDGIPVSPGGRVIVGETAFVVTDMKWENFGGHAPLKTKAVIADAGEHVANHMLWEADGLTLTGAVYKYMQEMLHGCAPCSQAHAERVAGRLSARLTNHIECAQAENKRISERLKKACDLAEHKQRFIENQEKLLTSHREEISALNQRIALLELTLRDALRLCTNKELIREMADRESKSAMPELEYEIKIRSERMACEEIKKRDAEIKRLLEDIKTMNAEIAKLRRMAIPDGESYAATCLAKARMEAAEREVVLLRAELQKKQRNPCVTCSANQRIDEARAETLAVQRGCDKQIEGMREECRACLLEKNKQIADLEVRLAASRANSFWQADESFILGMQRRLNECSARDKSQQAEIKNLQSAVGKKRNKALRLGKKIEAQNAEIHRLNELLRAIRLRYEGNDVKSFARMANGHDDAMDAMAYALWDTYHPNCRCSVDPIVIDDDASSWINRLSVTIAPGRSTEDILRDLSNYVPYAIRVHEGVASMVRVDKDDRPYAVLCGHCGQVIMETDACCKHCGASNRPCSTCRHHRKEPDESCTTKDCNNNSRWEERNE